MPYSLKERLSLHTRNVSMQQTASTGLIVSKILTAMGEGNVKCLHDGEGVHNTGQCDSGG